MKLQLKSNIVKGTFEKKKKIKVTNLSHLIPSNEQKLLLLSKLLNLCQRFNSYPNIGTDRKSEL